MKVLYKLQKISDKKIKTFTNTEYKIGITGLKEPSDIDGIEQYSIFNVQVRKYGDTDKSPSI